MRKALVLDRDPFQNRDVRRALPVGSMEKIADADLVIVVKGDEAKIIKLAWADPADYEVEVVRP